MFALAVAPERNHVRVFAEEQNIGNCVCFARFDEFVL